jgi:hypothetical protein
MEPECSVPCSQEPATDPYPETDKSSPLLTTLIPQDSFQYYPTIYAYLFRTLSSFQIFRPNTEGTWRFNSDFMKCHLHYYSRYLPLNVAHALTKWRRTNLPSVLVSINVMFLFENFLYKEI